jgi:hypothetical protein
MKKILLVLAFFSVLSFNVNATAITFLCDFPNYVSQTESINDNNFSLEFNYDTISKQAFMKGNLGLSEVIAISGSDGLSFIEILDTGVVQTTTLDMLSNKEQSVDAVHSRHTILFGLFPSQAYGKCKIINN